MAESPDGSNFVPLDDGHDDDDYGQLAHPQPSAQTTAGSGSSFFEHWFVRKYLVFVMIGAAVLTFVAAATLRSGDDTLAVDQVIEEVVPNDGDEVLAQNPVGIDLIAGYTANLTINGVDIPESQLRRIDALNQVTFQPDAGKAIEALRADVNCATATYWPLDQGEAASSSYTWCFNAT